MSFATVHLVSLPTTFLSHDPFTDLYVNDLETWGESEFMNDGIGVENAGSNVVSLDSVRLNVTDDSSDATSNTAFRFGDGTGDIFDLPDDVLGPVEVGGIVEPCTDDFLKSWVQRIPVLGPDASGSGYDGTLAQDYGAAYISGQQYEIPILDFAAVTQEIDKLEKKN